MKKSIVITSIFTALLLSIDQAAKWLGWQYLQQPVVFAPWLQLSLSRNTGIAWSIHLPFPLLLFLNFFLIGLFIYFAVKYFDLSRSGSQLITALILGGALGNLADRLIHGYVVDFISIGFWPVFNLADAFLSIGIFLILLFYAKIKRKD